MLQNFRALQVFIGKYKNTFDKFNLKECLRNIVFDITKMFSSTMGRIQAEICMHVLLHTYDFVGLAYQGNDIVFRFIIEYSSLMDFGP
jgi:hypothetical protein